MRFLVIAAAVLAASVGAAEAATNATPALTPQIPTLRLGTPLAPDSSLPISGYAAGYGVAVGGFQFGNNIAAPSGVFYAAFQKKAFPFRR